VFIHFILSNQGEGLKPKGTKSPHSKRQVFITELTNSTYLLMNQKQVNLADPS